MQEIRNPYEVLGIPNFSDMDAITKRYRSLALQHHPDRGGDTEKMKDINSSYDLLYNHKAEIDRALQRALNPMPMPIVVVYSWSGGNGWTGATNSASNFY